MVQLSSFRGADTGADHLIVFPYGYVQGDDGVDGETKKILSIDNSRLKYYPCLFGRCCKVGAASANESRAHEQYAAHHETCHKVQDPALSFLVACVVCNRVFESVASLGRHVEHHAMIIGIRLASREGNNLCCEEAGSDDAKNDDILGHIRKWHMPNRPYMCSSCGITTSSYLALCM